MLKRSRQYFFFISVCLLSAAFCAIARADDNDEDVKAALEFVNHLASTEFEEATKRFDETMRGAMSSGKLRSLWLALEDQNGKHVRFGSPTTGQIGRYTAIYIPTEFKKLSVKLKVVFDRTHHIAGFFILAADSAEGQPSQPAPYDSPEKYTETAVKFGDTPWQVDGILTMPKAGGPVPAVILVHGSGPHDADETIGPNKPFRDLAGGLSSRGIAVLRYKKRTFAHQEKVLAQGSITIREEVMDDALAGLRFLHKQANIDPKQIYLLGHSLGACVAPLIAKEDGKLAGIILLSGTPRSSFNVVLEQLRYIASIPGPEQEMNERVYKQALAIIKKARKSSEMDTASLLGAPIAYWKDWNRVAAQVRNVFPTLDCRILIASGGRDYQITRKDFDTFKALTKDRPQVALKWYADLNHLYMTGRGKATPSEYNNPGHVDPAVINDLANWIIAKKMP